MLRTLGLLDDEPALGVFERPPERGEVSLPPPPTPPSTPPSAFSASSLSLSSSPSSVPRSSLRRLVEFSDTSNDLSRGSPPAALLLDLVDLVEVTADDVGEPAAE